MSEQGSSQTLDDGARQGLVRPLSRAAHRPCARPGCPSPASATLGFRYHSREAWLASLAERDTPATYDLCAEHADRTRAPHGWSLEDERPGATDAGSAAPAEAHDTVTVLAAALRALPSGPDAPAPSTVTAAQATLELDASPAPGHGSSRRPGPGPRSVPAADRRASSPARAATPGEPAAQW